MIFGSQSSPADPLEVILCLLPGVVLDGRTIAAADPMDGLVMLYLSPEDVRGLILVSFTDIGLN